MKSDGNKTEISSRSRRPAGKIDGKRGPGDQLQNEKSTAKYTLLRSKEDIDNIEKLRNHLREDSWKSYNTDSEIYQDLPDLYFDAVNRVQQLQLQVEELTAKLDVMEDLRSSVCRILEICKDEE